MPPDNQSPISPLTDLTQQSSRHENRPICFGNGGTVASPCLDRNERLLSLTTARTEKPTQSGVISQNNLLTFARLHARNFSGEKTRGCVSLFLPGIPFGSVTHFVDFRDASIDGRMSPPVHGPSCSAKVSKGPTSLGNSKSTQDVPHSWIGANRSWRGKIKYPLSAF